MTKHFEHDPSPVIVTPIDYIEATGLSSHFIPKPDSARNGMRFRIDRAVSRGRLESIHHEMFFFIDKNAMQRLGYHRYFIFGINSFCHFFIRN